MILILATIAAIMLPPLTFPGLWTIPQLAVRSAIMFSAGALLYQWRDRIPARWSLVAVSVVIVLLSGMLPDYRVLGALPLAYAVVVSGPICPTVSTSTPRPLSSSWPSRACIP
ncbi:Probable acetyltransferase AtfA [Mycobacteroides abscessus subsp. abscessus]|nr:Probable acetyltransferase AtfA [Mycobacteroides abscessus subsp. abscessus]